MKTVIYKCLGHFVLRIILLLFWSCKGLAQSSLPSATPFALSSEISSSSLDKTSSLWTFTGEGYIAVYPLNLSNQNPHYKLSFRTRNRYGTLFCHILKDLKQLKESKLDNYEFCAEFHEGSLQISYHIDNLVETVLVGKALNDDHWHSLELQLLTSGDLIVSLDGVAQSEPLTSPAYFIDWNKLSSVTLFGGKDKESQHHPFIGCIKDIQINNANGTYITVYNPIITGPVETGCQDKCVTETPCHARTPCTNHYSHVKCNCYGTGLQGEFCEQKGSTKITLRGYEWITYKLYDKPEDRQFTDHNIFSLQFKSDRASGVLIYAVGSYPYDCHVIASVHEGIVTASVGFRNDVTLEADLGIAVNDFRQEKRWHNLTIYHNKNTVTFSLDKEVKVKTTDSSDYVLSLDPEIFFGGGDMFVITKGLQVTLNFIGCLKNVYVNDMSLVYEMKHGNDQVIHSGGHKPYYGCHKVDNIPLSFPQSDTMIVLDTPSRKDLQVMFGFRTVRDTAIIFYARVISLEDFGIGYFEIWIRNHQVILQLVPSTRNPDTSKDIIIDRVVNNNEWHTLHLHFKERSTYIKIDDLSKKFNHTGLLQLTDQMVLGHGLRQVYGAHDGFVGCIRNLVIQNVSHDPIYLLHTHRGIYGVIADGCHLIPHCNNGPHCQHEGRCLADWNGVSCDCSKTAYEGHACHFPKYRTSCESYYQAGYRETGAYQIDLDGTGPQDPVYVWCVMGYLHGGEKYGMTKIDHNFVRDTKIRGKGMYDMRKLITYREMKREVLVKLTQKSTWCEQFVEYDCYSAPMRLGKSTIFYSASGEILELHYNTDVPGVTEADTLCSCRKRTCPEQKCKCDQGHAQWEKDSGYIRYKQQLPITEMRIMQTKSSLPQAGANLSLGPLKCWGEDPTRYATSVTFKSTSSYLHLKPWKSDSLQFLFRTHENSALLLNQTQSSNNSNSVVIAIVSDSTVKFTIRVHNQTFEEMFIFEKIINDGEWHYVTMEMDKHNIRCTVDQQRKILNLPEETVPKFEGGLYIGGYKDEVLMEGLKGCMRGFYYNHKIEDLSRFAHPSIPGVIAGCRASCQSNPCLNGGECVEHWGTYNCICTNKWAHWGDSCERNINKDEITFDGTKDSYLDLEGFKEDDLLDSTIIFSFRTFESRAILLYIYDALNNFLQLELEKGNRLKLTFNHFRTVVTESLTYRRYNDGKWKQVVIFQEENKGSNFKFNYTKMFVNSPDNFVVIPYSRVHLHDYSSISPYRRESVIPPRSLGRSNSFISEYYRIFVGGVPVNTSVIDNLSGCVRGLKIGNKVFSLQQEAHLRPGVANMCQEGCSPSPCEHNGKCLERWGHNKFSCDCHKTNFAGDRCQIEASGEFTGQTVLEYNFELMRKAKETESEKLNLSFQTSILPPGKQVFLAVIFSTVHKDKDLLLFALTSSGVAVKHYQQRISYTLLIEGNFADGRPHRLQYWRSNEELLLTVTPYDNLDDVSKAKVPNIQNPLDDLNMFMLGGGIISKLPSYIEKLEEFVNFTGCLSEVIFTPVTDEPYTVNPLKDLRSFNNDSITVHGDEIKRCIINKDEEVVTTTEKTYTTTTEINPDRTMPPWNPDPAKTIYLNAPSSTTTTTTEKPVVTTTVLEATLPTLPKVNTTTLSTSATERLNVTKTAIGHSNIGGTATELEIMVALGIVVGLMLIAVIIALVLCKKRRREKYVIEKKVPPDDLELKIPLNHTCSPPPSHRPYDHIARLDEFSMVSVTLGPKRRKENGIVPGSEPLLDGNEMSPGEYPVQSTFYNKKKNRPASSISEVLEEIERQRREKEIGENPEEGEDESKQKQDELEWDPMTDRTPLTSVPEFDSISEDFIYQMLPSPILSVMDDIEELSLESASTLGSLPSMKKPEDVDSEGDPLHVLEQHTDTLDANGDSGYEAESRKDGDEDHMDNTPPTPEKMYMYDISGQNWSSTPNRKLVDYEESIT